MRTVKVGDRVRATCGESVIVGTVMDVDEDGTEVNVGSDAGRYFLPDAWIIEVIAPPIPDVVGTIVRDTNGDAWQRYRGGWYSTRVGNDWYSLKDLQAVLAPIEVLWTPTP